MTRSFDRAAADDLADALVTPTAQALAEHVHVMTMRIRQLAGFARDNRSERHRRLAHAHALRSRGVA